MTTPRSNWWTKAIRARANTKVIPGSSRTILAAEELEHRLVPATFTWNGNIGTWTNPDCWTVTGGKPAKLYPTKDDTVIFGKGNLTCTIPKLEPASCKTLDIDGYTGTLSIDSTLTITGGKFTLNSAATISGLHLILKPSTQFVWSKGSIDINDLNINKAATMLVGDNAAQDTHLKLNNTTVYDNGQLTWVGGAVNGGGSILVLKQA